MNEWDKDSIKNSVERDINQKIRNKSSCRTGGHHGIIWGAVICTVGVVLLLDHMGIVSADRLWRFWPTLIIVAGVLSFTQVGKRAWGICLIVAGVLFQLDSLGFIRFHWADLWPLAIIAAGLMMIWGSIESRRARAASSSDAQTTMNVTAIFGGIERRVTAHDFRGGTVTAVFGGAELDFRDADMEGDEVVLEVNAVFGGAEIRVPESWRVEVRGQTLFGGYSDKTRGSAAGDVNAPRRKNLILTGTTLFGGVEIKN
jgi:predicted membrane protein